MIILIIKRNELIAHRLTILHTKQECDESVPPPFRFATPLSRQNSNELKRGKGIRSIHSKAGRSASGSRQDKRTESRSRMNQGAEHVRDESLSLSAPKETPIKKCISLSAIAAA
jgi:hypothetical protein